jgi:hypothetical protein
MVDAAGVEPAVPEAADLQSTGVTNFPTHPKTLPYKNTLAFYDKLRSWVSAQEPIGLPMFLMCLHMVGALRIELRLPG